MARYYPPTYRQREVSEIIGALDQGLSVSVVGPPSVGKSNLLRFLDQERVAVTDPGSPWLRYAPKSAEKGPLIVVPIDPNALLPPLPGERGQVAATSWPGFELLIHRLTITPEVYPTFEGGEPTLSGDLVERLSRLQDQFENAHPAVTDFEDSLHGHLALRYLESILEAAFASRAVQGVPLRIVFVMDEFERLLEAMPDYFFVALRSVRDRFKYQVMFVTFTRQTLPRLLGEGARRDTLEPFIELFHDNIVYLGPFSDDDAWMVIEQLERRSVPRDDHAAGLLMRATGGFAGLLRAGFKHVDKLQAVTAGEYRQAVALAATRLAAEPNVQAECRTLLRGLAAPEVKTLYAVMNQQPDIDEDTARELLHKGLLTHATPAGTLYVTPPVLAAYIRNHPTPPPPRPVTRPVTMPE